MKTFRLASLALLALLPIFGIPSQIAAAEEKTVIQLRSEFIVPQKGVKDVLLKDVAKSIQAPNPELKKRLENIVVMPSPEPGENKRLPYNYIIRAIRTAGMDFYHLYFEGAPVVEVYGPGKTVAIQTMIDKIKDHIREETDWPDDELVMRVISAPTHDARLPSEPTDIVVERNSPYAYGTGRYEVQFFIDDILTDRAPFVVSATRKRTAYVPIRDIKRGEVIGADDLRERIVFIDNVNEDQQIADSQDEMIGKRCRIAMRKNVPIQWNFLETNFILNRGDWVNLIVRNGGLTMQTMAKAQGRGAPGDVIPVKMDKTGQLVKAKIINRDYVIFAS
ncbi:MAG: flagellar basal body P-ring formation chaperone FlgA [Candidatus Omnitrophota bacterium]